MLLANKETFDIEAALGFGSSERLLTWAWRLIAQGRGDCPVLEREFAEACGEDAREVLATFVGFLQALVHTGRRWLVIGSPGSSERTADERRMLTLIAAAQADEPPLFEAHLDWLARAEARHVLAIGARALATALSVHGLCLALPASAAASGRNDAASTVARLT
ncbi:MAG TPA: hypothetical protein VE309_04075 [Caulobacteraceae bacterium]|nr:hypothetical protein [Caulobacteraceae bacterium]